MLLAPCLQLAAGLMRCRRAAAATAEALREAPIFAADPNAPSRHASKEDSEAQGLPKGTLSRPGSMEERSLSRQASTEEKSLSPPSRS